MRAVEMVAVGEPEVLQLVERVEPQVDSSTAVKVALMAAGINPIDTKVRRNGLFYPDALPAVIGCDGAGRVVEVGKAVSRFRVGDEVWFCHGGLGGAQGNYAEFRVLDECELELKPQNYSFEEAAAAPLVLLTAWEALFDRARLQAGQRVLIHAGAGGVGHVAIQLAKQAGAEVWTTVGSAEKAEFVRQLGADRTILYRDEDFVARVQAWSEGRGVDLVFDCVGGELFQRSMGAVAYYGQLVTILEPPANTVWSEARKRNLSVSFTLMLTPMLRDLRDARAHQGEILRRCARLAEQGELKIHLQHCYPLAEVVKAHAAIETGHTQGKLVLTL